MEESLLKYSETQYGDHDLQKVGVWELPDQTPKKNGHWIVFIHGGGWRDPRHLLQGFTPSIRALLRSGPGSTLNPLIAGFASIDYRLSPHPEFPQDPSSTPTYSFRNARHPDHILDVRSALASLQRRYGFGEQYILIGHSAGATLTYQLLMGGTALGGQAPKTDVALPRAFVGISGIYELLGLDERHDGGYTGFISGAFGKDKSCWNDSMPARFPGNFRDELGSSKAILAWSPEDSLIDEPEIDCMAERLLRDGVEVQIFKTLKGEHDFIWEDGQQVAKLVEQALQALGP